MGQNNNHKLLHPTGEQKGGVGGNQPLHKVAQLLLGDPDTLKVSHSVSEAGELASSLILTLL